MRRLTFPTQLRFGGRSFGMGARRLSGRRDVDARHRVRAGRAPDPDFRARLSPLSHHRQRAGNRLLPLGARRGPALLPAPGLLDHAAAPRPKGARPDLLFQLPVPRDRGDFGSAGRTIPDPQLFQRGGQLSDPAQSGRWKPRPGLALRRRRGRIPAGRPGRGGLALYVPPQAARPWRSESKDGATEPPRTETGPGYRHHFGRRAAALRGSAGRRHAHRARPVPRSISALCGAERDHGFRSRRLQLFLEPPRCIAIRS